MMTLPHKLPLRWEIGIAIVLCLYSTLFDSPSRWAVLFGCLSMIAAMHIADRRSRWIATAAAWVAPGLWLFASGYPAKAKESLLVVTIFLSLLNGTRVALAPREVRAPKSHRLLDIVCFAAMAELSGGRREMWMICGVFAFVTVTQLLVSQVRRKPEPANAQ